MAGPESSIALSRRTNKLPSWQRAVATVLIVVVLSACTPVQSISAAPKITKAARTTSKQSLRVIAKPASAKATIVVSALLLPGTIPAIKPSVISNGPRTNPKVALTFDDGPSDSTIPLLALLARNGVYATFCLIGLNIPSHADAVKTIAAAGDDLCDHTQTHADLAKLNTVDPSRVTNEILQPAQTIFALTGKWPNFLRPPGGSHRDATTNADVVAEPAAALGMKELLWETNGDDFANQNAASACYRILNGAADSRQAHEGSIILMHDRIDVPILSETQCVINGLKARGLQPVSVSELLAG